MMGMVSNMIASPDAFATSLGMDRVKRSAWDKEFNLEKKGFSFKIKYNDPSNKAKVRITIYQIYKNLYNQLVDDWRINISIN